jgi:2-haloacid dehalogenase
VRALDPHFERVFGDSGVRAQWLGQVLQSALVVMMTDNYVDFAQVGRSALEMMAARRGVVLKDEDSQTILGGMRQLPPHSEVLMRLKDVGLRLAALTNSPPAMVEAQLTSAGLIEYCDDVLSVDTVKKFKPAQEVYRTAARTLGIDTSDMLMVATHDWDIAGAMNAGCRGAFIARPGMVINPLYPMPDIFGPDLAEVVDEILASRS